MSRSHQIRIAENPTNCCCLHNWFRFIRSFVQRRHRYLRAHMEKCIRIWHTAPQTRNMWRRMWNSTPFKNSDFYFYFFLFGCGGAVFRLIDRYFMCIESASNQLNSRDLYANCELIANSTRFSFVEMSAANAFGLNCVMNTFSKRIFQSV